MSEIEVIEVTSAKLRREFVEVPHRLHGDEDNWHPPLISEQLKLIDPRRGPYFSHGEAKLWLAVRDGKPIGRISAHFSTRYDEFMGGRKGFFGFFCCENDVKTAQLLLRTAEAFLESRDREEIEGPYCFTVYDELGILIDGFETTPTFMVSYNPPYYANLVEQAGYAKAVDWLVYRGRRGETDTHLSERLTNLADQITQSRRLKIRPVDVKDFRLEATKVKQIFDDAWEKNWGHVPMSDQEFWGMAEGLKQILVPELSFMVEVDGEVAGMAISIYDINPIVKQIRGKLWPWGFIRLVTGVKRCKRFRMILMGVLPKYRGRGYEVAIYVETIRRAREMGFEEAEMSLIVENNEPMIKSIENLEATIAQRLRLYNKPLA